MENCITIEGVKAREILDSRGNPTVEVEVFLEDGTFGIASVPSGVSIGSHEACELRDHDSKRFDGNGVLMAVQNVNEEINNMLIGSNITSQIEIDEMLINLDNTKDKSRLGANAILATSIACTRAAANTLSLPLYRYLGGVNAKVLPIPMMNVLNGGTYANNNIDCQEIMIIPIGASFSESIRMAVEIYKALKKDLLTNEYNTNIGDEGGFAPDFSSTETAIEILLKSIKNAGFEQGEDVGIALDFASSELYLDKEYHFKGENITRTTSDMIDYIAYLCEKYPIFSVEDGLSEDDFQGWKELYDRIGDFVKLVGDDLFATNTERIEMGIEDKLANAVLIKPNQIGTVTEAIDAASLTHKSGWSTIISHRSGDTDDSFIADLAVALNAGFIKTGAPCRSERNAKYNQLLRIEEELGFNAVYGDFKFRASMF